MENLQKQNIYKPKKLNTKGKKAFEKTLLLYEKSKINLEIKKILELKNEEYKIKQDLINCTFKPKINDKSINRSHSNVRIVNKNTTIYERTVYKKKLKKQIIEKNEEDKLRNMKKTFINKINPDELFDISKSVANDYSTRNHIERLQRSRNKREEILFKTECRKYYYPTTNLKNEDISRNNSYNNANKEVISAIKKNLHDELHSIDVSLEQD